MDRPMPIKKQEPKEKITSRISVLGDTGSSWSSVASGPSLATTTATIASIAKSTGSKIHQRIQLALEAKGKLPKASRSSDSEEEAEKKPEPISILKNLRIRSGHLDTRTLSNVNTEGDTIAKPDHVDELLNQAIMSVDTVLQDMAETNRKRPKNMMLGKAKSKMFSKLKCVILGTYFPSIAALLFPPLWGTRMFPLMANQEKLHFVVATDGQLDRFDGDADESYLQDVKVHTNKILAAWDVTAPSYDFLQFDSVNLIKDFKKKFPFAGQRYGQKCWARKKALPEDQPKRGEVRKWNTPSQGTSRQSGSLATVATAKPQRSDPRRSNEELRLAKVRLR